MVRIFCLYRTASPNNDTRLQTTDINKISLRMRSLHCINRMKSNVVVFRPLHQIERKGVNLKSKLHYIELEILYGRRNSFSYSE